MFIQCANKSKSTAGWLQGGRRNTKSNKDKDEDNQQGFWTASTRAEHTKEWQK